MSKKDFNTDSLFDNEFVKAAKNSLTLDQKERYRIIGEELYGKIDFETSEFFEDVKPKFAEICADLTEQIKSGLHPSQLEDNEKQIMKETIGEEWYKNFGFVKEDLNNIVTIKF